MYLLYKSMLGNSYIQLSAAGRCSVRSMVVSNGIVKPYIFPVEVRHIKRKSQFVKQSWSGSAEVQNSKNLHPSDSWRSRNRMLCLVLRWHYCVICQSSVNELLQKNENIYQRGLNMHRNGNDHKNCPWSQSPVNNLSPGARSNRGLIS